ALDLEISSRCVPRPSGLDGDDDRIVRRENRLAVVYVAPGIQVEGHRPLDMVNRLSRNAGNVGVLGVAAEIVPQRRRRAIFQFLYRDDGAAVPLAILADCGLLFAAEIFGEWT